MARTVVSRIPLDRLRDQRLLALEAHFLGISYWAGMSAAKEETTNDERGLIESYSVRLEATPDIHEPLGQGRRLVLSTTWRTSGPSDDRRLLAPVSFRVEAQRPVDVWALLEPILRIQDLINVAYGGFVAANGGTARLDVEARADGRPDSLPDMWNGALMVALPGSVQPRPMAEFPLFSLASLGGAGGLRRWIAIWSRFRRAVVAAVGHDRLGRVEPSLSLLEVAAGIEYWVKANRPAKWSSSGKFPEALALRVGESFTSWVGDPKAWAKELWDTYNSLKHNTVYEVDPYRCRALAESGRLLLLGALLDRVAGTKQPSRSIFASHRTDDLGRELRDPVYG